MDLIIEDSLDFRGMVEVMKYFDCLQIITKESYYITLYVWNVYNTGLMILIKKATSSVCLFPQLQMLVLEHKP